MDDPRPAQPPPAAPRFATRRPINRRAFLLVAVVAAGTLGGSAWRSWRRSRAPEPGPSPIAAAEKFVDALIRAEGTDEASGEETGYEAAYALLSDAAREAKSLESFFEEWTARAEAAGFFVEKERLGRNVRRGIRNGRVSFQLRARDDSAGSAGSHVLELTLVFERGAWAIAAYALTRPEASSPR